LHQRGKRYHIGNQGRPLVSLLFVSPSWNKHTRTKPCSVNTGQGYFYTCFSRHQGGKERCQAGFQVAFVVPKQILDSVPVFNKLFGVIDDELFCFLPALKSSG